MAETQSIPTYELNDASTLPAIGFGTYPLRGEDGVRSIVSALEVGYRLLDTAVNYENEAEVGEAIRRSGVPREELVGGRRHIFEAEMKERERTHGHTRHTARPADDAGPQ